MEPKARNAKITDFQPDPANPNKGSERGYRMLNDSLRKLGAGRSIVVDKNGIVIAGNKTQENAVDIGLEDAVVVQTDGNQIVVVQRTDLDLLNDPDHKARQLSIADNRTSDFMEWDAEQIQALIDQDMDLSDFFHDWELDKLIHGLEDESVDYDEHWQDMPEFEQGDIKSFHTIKVHFKTLEDLQAFAALVKQTVTDKTTYIFYPQQIKEELTKRAVIDES